MSPMLYEIILNTIISDTSHCQACLQRATEGKNLNPLEFWNFNLSLTDFFAEGWKFHPVLIKSICCARRFLFRGVLKLSTNSPLYLATYFIYETYICDIHRHCSCLENKQVSRRHSINCHEYSIECDCYFICNSLCSCLQ